MLDATLWEGSLSPSEQVLAEGLLRSRGTKGSSWALTTGTSKGIGDEERLADKQSGVDTLLGVARRWLSLSPSEGEDPGRTIVQEMTSLKSPTPTNPMGPPGE